MARMHLDYPRATLLEVQPAPVTCANIEFIGARGSGENPFEYDGLGKTIQDVKNGLAAQGVSMKVTPLPYPAVKVSYAPLDYPIEYRESLKAGVSSLASYMAQLSKTCPTTRIVLVGYSQGAHVVADVATALPANIQDQIVGIVLFGDPLFNPSLTGVNKGSYENVNGVWSAPYGPGRLPQRQIGDSLIPKLASYCLLGDANCNFTPPNVASCMTQPTDCPHEHYATVWTDAAAVWLKDKIAKM